MPQGTLTMKQHSSVDILKRLGSHHRELYSRMYEPIEEKHMLEEQCWEAFSGVDLEDSESLKEGIDPSVDGKLCRIDELDEYEIRDSDDAAYWSHALLDYCLLLELETGISRYVLEEAACRLNTRIGLGDWTPKSRPSRKNVLEFIPILRKLDADGRTQVVWEDLVEAHTKTLKEAGLLGKMSKEQANNRAMVLGRADSDFEDNPNVKIWAKKIGCSTGLVVNLPFYRKCAEEAGTARRGQPLGPKTVSLTTNVLATVACEDEELGRLIAEQHADREPSPLAPDPPDKSRKVRQYKRS
jgi:hypothetical protein